MNFSINMAPFPKAAFASELARSNNSCTSSIFRTTLIPRPPPPYAALNMTGRPYLRQNSMASSVVVTGPGVPGTTGTPASMAAFRAATLSPICSTTFGVGPINRKPASMQA